jgi:antitoxin VapB
MNARLPTTALPVEAQKDSTVFTSGNSQAVRIPKEFQLKTKQVKIIQRGDELVIKPKYKTGAEVLANLPPIDADNPHEWDVFDQAVQSLRKEPAQKRDWGALFGASKKVSKPSASKAAASPKARKKKAA